MKGQVEMLNSQTFPSERQESEKKKKDFVVLVDK